MVKKEKKVLILAGGYDQIALIKEFKKRKYKVILADYYENPPAKKYADKHYQISTLDEDAVKKVAILENVNIITTACTDQALLTMAKISEELKLPCNLTYQDALNVTNKLYMKSIFKENSIPTSEYVIVSDKNKISEIKIPFPLVVKPVDCNSSKGVKKINNIKEMEIAVEDAIKLSRTNNAIVEKYIDGIEISVDAFIYQNKAMLLSYTQTEKIKNEDKFVIYRSKYPAILSDDQIKKIKIVIQQIADSFHLNNVPLLVQLIADKNNIYILEFSARMGGGSKYYLINKLTNMDIMKVYVDSVLNKKIEINIHNKYNYAILNYVYVNNGIYNKLVNYEKLKKEKVIDKYFTYKTKGIKIEKIENSGDRVAGYLILAKNKEEIIKKQQIALEMLSVKDIDNNDIFKKELYNIEKFNNQ